MESIKKIVDDNVYLKKYVRNSAKNKYSISYIIEKNMCQSDCIKFGIALEKILNDIILQNTCFIDIKQNNMKNKKEKDHLFLDFKNKIVYYSELKTNLNLDTEKTKYTIQKFNSIQEELRIDFPDYKIKSYLVCLRYYEEIPKFINKKFSVVKISSTKDYLNGLGIDIKFSEEDYVYFINYIACKMA